MEASYQKIITAGEGKSIYADSNGYLWNQNKSGTNAIYLTCIKKPASKGGCRATAYISLDNRDRIIYRRPEHDNHGVLNIEIEQRNAVETMKKRVQQEPTRTRQIFDEERRKM